MLHVFQRKWREQVEGKKGLLYKQGYLMELINSKIKELAMVRLLT